MRIRFARRPPLFGGEKSTKLSPPSADKSLDPAAFRRFSCELQLHVRSGRAESVGNFLHFRQKVGTDRPAADGSGRGPAKRTTQRDARRASWPRATGHWDDGGGWDLASWIKWCRTSATCATSEGVNPCQPKRAEPFNPPIEDRVEQSECFYYVLHLRGLYQWEIPMADGGGFGTSWCLATAIEHIECIEAYEREQEFYRVIFDDETIELGAGPVPDRPNVRDRSLALVSIDGLLLALRDGYVRATGRRSTTRRSRTTSDTNGWRLHSTDPTLITTDEWRSGELDPDCLMLTGSTWQYMQIEVPDFMVKAIWPDWPPCDVPATSSEAARSAYTTPYLELMQAAIAHFRLTPENQSKKENLLDWFLTQQIEGEPISNKLADAMATLIRLPSAQRGGAKRVIGPYLRKT